MVRKAGDQHKREKPLTSAVTDTFPIPPRVSAAPTARDQPKRGRQAGEPSEKASDQGVCRSSHAYGLAGTRSKPFRAPVLVTTLPETGSRSVGYR
jgi:hypothetical protein